MTGRLWLSRRRLNVTGVWARLAGEVRPARHRAPGRGRRFGRAVARHTGPLYSVDVVLGLAAARS